MKIFKNLFNKNLPSWEEVKASNKAFPETKITIVKEEFEDGEVRTAWINVGYKDYPYKEHCSTLGILNVDFEDMNGLDYGEIQTYLENELNKACISHLISRITTDNGIEMLFYFEDEETIHDKLEKLYASEDLLVDFGCRIQSDPNWETVENMLNEYSD